MKVLWNDQIVDREAVKIDIEDRGYQYGDGIYEVIRIYNGRCFMLGEHMTRLESSAQKIKLTLPYTISQLTENLSYWLKPKESQKERSIFKSPEESPLPAITSFRLLEQSKES